MSNSTSSENHSKLPYLTVLLLCLISISGCRERQLARVTPQMDIEPRFWIRVLLFDNMRSCGLQTLSSFSVIEPQRGMAQASFNRVDTPRKISVSEGKIIIDGKTFTESVIILPHKPHIFTVNGKTYRGKLQLIVNSDGKSFNAVNLVPLEPYLAGVIGAEMPNYWEPAALKAQAIAARTYCLYIKKRFGTKRDWDVRKTQANQVYLGVSAESAQVWKAVNETYGQVMVCKQPDGTEGIFPSYYSSTCGGHTESSKNVFGDSFEPLTGVPCPYCKDVAKPKFFFWPMIQLDKSDVTSRLSENYPKVKELGEIKGITTAKQSDYGNFSRLTLVKLLGSTGKSLFLRAEDFRLSIDPSGSKLKSTICQIVSMGDKWAFLSGRGYGHGVGMCQCGAQAMARKGKSAIQILYYYYPRSDIVSIY